LISKYIWKKFNVVYLYDSFSDCAKVSHHTGGLVKKFPPAVPCLKKLIYKPLVALFIRYKNLHGLKFLLDLRGY